ncbi:hypothetical protein RUM43_000352 [Polyplax serrata]|uniref:Uncharacterized protein n=1 Tax=Polyplax serrata TaxID=468196 RepID=A0AAN8SFT9_POLSC
MRCIGVRLGKGCHPEIPIRPNLPNPRLRPPGSEKEKRQVHVKEDSEEQGTATSTERKTADLPIAKEFKNDVQVKEEETNDGQCIALYWLDREKSPNPYRKSSKGCTRFQRHMND